MIRRVHLILISALILAISAVLHSNIVEAAADHVVISEVQVGGINADDEFVELYNPTGSDVSLTGWRLSVKSSAGTSTSNLLTAFPDLIIKSHGYFLIASPEYDGPTPKDIAYSTSAHVGTNNTVILYSDAGDTAIDIVGMGTAVIKEIADAPLPANDSSVERVSGIDTGNNFADFQVRTPSDPQNSGFVEETPSPTPSTTPTPTATETPTPEPTASPTIEPTASPTPTLEPTPTTASTSTPANKPPGWSKSPVFTCQNTHVPVWVYALLKFLMPQKFNC